MQIKTSIEEMLKSDADRREFTQEELALDATELISMLMEQNSVSKAELARRTGKSKAYISQVLSGSRNMTMHTLAELVYVFGQKVQLKAVALALPMEEVQCSDDIGYIGYPPALEQGCWFQNERAERPVHFALAA